jgi:hypothetical protein
MVGRDEKTNSSERDSAVAFLERIVAALQLAALPAKEQRQVLPDFVAVHDEIALTYEDAFRLVPLVRAGGMLDDAQVAVLAELDHLYEEMTDAEDRDWVWSLDAMETDERWERSRSLARKALSLLGKPSEEPELKGITWIEGSD